MEGNTVQSRSWKYLTRILPTPVRWISMEFVRFLHWVDQFIGYSIASVRSAPAWFFVTGTGIFCVGLTVALFISLAEQKSKGKLANRSKQSATAKLGREQLERSHDWSTEDRWRVAHLFVPHKPVQGPKNIQIDSRLNATVANARESGNGFSSWKSWSTDASSAERDFDVRLDLSRPNRAEQDYRVVRSSIRDTERRSARPAAQIQRRDPRLLVQAAWAFGAECNQYNYVGRPTRRRIPVTEPQPIPEAPKQPIPKSRPDLSFDLTMIRQTLTAGMFPPGSHIVSQSKRTEFPDDLRNRIAFSSFPESIWELFHHRDRHSEQNVKPYEGIGIHDPQGELISDSDDGDLTLPAASEVELRVELQAPRSVAAGHLNHSRLRISNEGMETLPKIEVHDLISHLKTVVAARPDALIDATIDTLSGMHSRNLYREIRGLVPKDEHEFDLSWISTTADRQYHRVRVVTHAAVATLTEVVAPATDQPMQSIPPETPPEKLAEKRPALACDIQYIEQAYIGENVDLQIAVRNTGDTDLHDVKVRVEIPDQFSHDEGKSVVISAGTIAVGGRSDQILKMSAIQIGDVANELRVAAAEHIVAKGKAKIAVVERPKDTPPAPEQAKPVTPKPIAKPAAPAAPAAVQSINSCSCQPVFGYQPWFWGP